MKKTLATIAALAGLGLLAAPGRAINFGVNGHPGTQDAYRNISVSSQISLINGLGAKWYRGDWNETAYNANPSYFLNLVNTAAANGVTILPVLSPIQGCWSSATTTQIQTDSYNYGYAVASAMGSKVTYYELDNELDGYAINSGSDGTQLNSYDPTKIGRAFTEVNALAQGIKAANPSAKVMIDAGWVHFGFIHDLINNGFTYDVLAWHWYSDMGDITSVGSYGNVWSTLTGFGKPIWITEGGNRNTTDNDAAQGALIASQASQFRQLGAASYFEYELLDEPYFSGNEAWYGLYNVSWNGSAWTLGAAKPAFTSYKNVISGGGAIANGTYTLTPSFATGSRLDASGWGTAAGTPTDIWAASGGANQKWIFTHTGNGYYKIQPSYATALALDVYSGAVNSAGAASVDLYTDNGGWAQRWTPVWVNGAYSFIPQCAPNSRLDVTGANSANGTPVEVYASNSSPAQSWNLGTN